MRSRYDGGIRIDPPMNWEEIRRVLDLPRMKDGWEVRLVVEEHTEHTKTGQMTIKVCSEIMPWSTYPYKGYYVQEAIQSIIDACPDLTFSGYLDVVLEDGSEFFRWAVKNGREVVRVDPVIAWEMPR